MRLRIPAVIITAAMICLPAVAHHTTTATYHGLPYCGQVDDNCYLPARLSQLPGHRAAVILDGTLYLAQP